MHAYELLGTIGKVLLVAYLVLIPWTLGAWMWLPLCTGGGALLMPLMVLFHGPKHIANAAVLHQRRELWATHVFEALGYLAYYIAAVVLTIWIQTKWMEHEDAKDRRPSKVVRPTPVTVTRVPPEGKSKQTRAITSAQTVNMRKHGDPAR